MQEFFVARLLTFEVFVMPAQFFDDAVPVKAVAAIEDVVDVLVETRITDATLLVRIERRVLLDLLITLLLQSCNLLVNAAKVLSLVVDNGSLVGIPILQEGHHVALCGLGWEHRHDILERKHGMLPQHKSENRLQLCSRILPACIVPEKILRNLKPEYFSFTIFSLSTVLD